MTSVISLMFIHLSHNLLSRLLASTICPVLYYSTYLTIGYLSYPLFNQLEKTNMKTNTTAMTNAELKELAIKNGVDIKPFPRIDPATVQVFTLCKDMQNEALRVKLAIGFASCFEWLRKNKMVSANLTITDNGEVVHTGKVGKTKKFHQEMYIEKVDKEDGIHLSCRLYEKVIATVHYSNQVVKERVSQTGYEDFLFITMFKNIQQPLLNSKIPACWHDNAKLDDASDAKIALEKHIRLAFAYATLELKGVEACLFGIPNFEGKVFLNYAMVNVADDKLITFSVMTNVQADKVGIK